MQMFYSASTGGFFCLEVHGEEGVPDGSIAISSNEYSELLVGLSKGLTITINTDGRPVAVNPPSTPAPPPTVITMRQARLALLSAGLLNDVDAAISALPSPRREAAQIEWQFGSEVVRGSPLVALLSVAVGLTDTDLDTMFEMASHL